MESNIATTNRIIQIYNSANGELHDIETNSEKWAEVSAIVREKTNINLSEMKAVLGSTEGVLELPNAVIPPGNQMIYLVKAKMKSGADKSFVDMGYNDLRAEYKKAREKNSELPSLGANPKREDLINNLQDYYNTKSLKPKAKKELVTKVKAEAKESYKKSESELDSRVEALENILGTIIEKGGEFFDSLRGIKTDKSKKVVINNEDKIENTSSKLITNNLVANPIPNITVKKTKAEAAEEFRKLGI